MKSIKHPKRPRRLFNECSRCDDLNKPLKGKDWKDIKICWSCHQNRGHTIIHLKNQLNQIRDILHCKEV